MKKPLWLRVSQWLVVSIILAVFVGHMWQQRTILKDLLSQANGLWAGLSLGLIVISQCLNYGTWCRLVQYWLPNHQMPHAAHVYFLTLLGKYVPGKIWTYVARNAYVKDLGMSVKNMTKVSFWEIVTTVISGLGVAFCAVWPLWGLSAGLVILVGIHLVSGWSWAKLLVRTTVRYAISWSLTGLAIGLLLKSYYPECELSAIPGIIKGFTLSCVGGFVSLFASGGLGVREGLLSAFLQSDYPPVVVSSLPVFARIWMTLAELLMVVLSKWTKR